MGDDFVKPVLTPAAIEGSLLTTVNGYTVIQVNSADYFKIRGYRSIMILADAATNDLHFKVETSHDAVKWRTKKEDWEITAGETDGESMMEPWNYMKISVKPQVGGAHGTGSFQIEGSSL